MNEQTTFEGVSVYPASRRDYANYFSEMFHKRSYDDKLSAPFFYEDNFKTAPGTAVGFTNFQQILQFKRCFTGLVRDQPFYGINGKRDVSF